jgi:hypothetical protein
MKNKCYDDACPCALASLHARSDHGSGPFLPYFLGKQKVRETAILKQTLHTYQPRHFLLLNQPPHEAQVPSTGGDLGEASFQKQKALLCRSAF